MKRLAAKIIILMLITTGVFLQDCIQVTKEFDTTIKELNKKKVN